MMAETTCVRMVPRIVTMIDSTMTITQRRMTLVESKLPLWIIRSKLMRKNPKISVELTKDTAKFFS